jgi:hypothetical protein
MATAVLDTRCRSLDHPMEVRVWCEACLAWKHGLHGYHHLCPGETSNEEDQG